MSLSDLATYELQLQQVEVALTTDPDNAELQTLKQDLQQVIDLTKELIAAQLDSADSSAAKSKKKPLSEDASADPSLASSSTYIDHLTPIKHWQVGEKCQAIWNKDGQYYEALIDEITADGQVSVTFLNYGNTGVTTLGLLKMSSSGISKSTSATNKKEQLAKHREYVRNKKLKKQERIKQLDKEREDEKSKWQTFSSKAFGKKGFVKKSIFKTPENEGGRVGVGTCGVSGKAMTTFTSGPKHRKGV